MISVVSRRVSSHFGAHLCHSNQRPGAALPPLPRCLSIFPYRPQKRIASGSSRPVRHSQRSLFARRAQLIFVSRSQTPNTTISNRKMIFPCVCVSLAFVDSLGCDRRVRVSHCSLFALPFFSLMKFHRFIHLGRPRSAAHPRLADGTIDLSAAAAAAVFGRSTSETPTRSGNNTELHRSKRPTKMSSKHIRLILWANNSATD